jgi:hypothetical protein
MSSKLAFTSNGPPIITKLPVTSKEETESQDYSGGGLG